MAARSMWPGSVPRIGILLRREISNSQWVNFLAEFHFEAIAARGAIPIPIPVVRGVNAQLPYYKSQIQGLVMAEGPDIDPQYHRATAESAHMIADTSPFKDRVEISLCRFALKTRLPILGICRGAQLLNVVGGGTLFNDVQKELHSPIVHKAGCSNQDARHGVRLIPDTPIHKWYKRETMNVNTYHHQGVRTLGRRFRPMAVAEDGLVEAFYDPGATFCVGLQFHPERPMDADTRQGNNAVFESFIDACHARLREQGSEHVEPLPADMLFLQSGGGTNAGTRVVYQRKRAL